METDTAVEPRQHLEQLRAVLIARGWPAEVVGDARRLALCVRNPADAGLNVNVVSRDGRYCWPQGWIIDGTNVHDVVAAVQHVLREVYG